jgi:galactoside O-acetyltransferase
MARSSFYTDEELKEIGFSGLGNDVRNDDFCIISGSVKIGRNVHIAAGVYLFGGEGIELQDFVGISSRSSVYSVSDDYSGEFLTNPTIPDEYKHIIGEKVIFERHALVGAGCTILPGARLGEGSAVGAMSLVAKRLEPWTIYVGIPARRVKERSRRLLDLEKSYTLGEKS